MGHGCDLPGSLRPSSGCRTDDANRPDPAIRLPAVAVGTLYIIWAKAAIDPRGAVAIIEALPPGGADSDHPTNRDRIELATWLAESAESRLEDAFGVTWVSTSTDERSREARTSPGVSERQGSRSTRDFASTTVGTDSASARV